jgi:hypothetical protein
MNYDTVLPQRAREELLGRRAARWQKIALLAFLTLCPLVAPGILFLKHLSLSFHLNLSQNDLKPTSITVGEHKYVWTESDNPQIGWHWVKVN